MNELRRARGPLVLVVAALGGVLAVERYPGRSAGALAAGGAIAALMALGARGRVGLAVGGLAVACLAAGAMQHALDGIASSPLTALAERRETVTLTGTLTEDPVGGRFSARVLVKVAEARERLGMRRVDRSVLAVATGDMAMRVRILVAGDRVTLQGRLEPLDGYDARLRWRHAVARLRVNRIEDLAGATSVLPIAADEARDAVLRGGRVLDPTDRSVITAFLLGDTRAVPRTVLDDFRASGLSHLLVVSGANVAFVLALAGPVLRRLPLLGRVAGALAVLLLFGAMTRWEPSVLRAVVMAGCAQLAALLGRPAPALRVLALAVLVLVLADPFLVHSVGFLLSAGACAGLSLLGPPLASRLPGPAPVRETAAASLAAQAGVAPVLLPVFGSIPLVALPANLLAAAAAAPLTVLGLLGGVLGGLLAPISRSAAQAAQLPAVACERWIVLVAHVAARVPVALDGRAFWGVAALVAAVGAWRARRQADRPG